MTLFQIVSIVITLAAMGAYINHRFVKLPSTIGYLAFALFVSCAIILLSDFGLIDIKLAASFVRQIDFSEVVLHGMLSVLLFSGALHINLDDLKNAKFPVLILATFGVVSATFITGTITWWGASLIGISLPYIYALLFGALISPTDPIAVLSILKKSGASKNLYAKTGGESLFNDGVGVVVFIAILGVLSDPTDISFSQVGGVGGLFLWEALGGGFLGGLLGWGIYRMLRSINHYQTEVMLTLALVTGGYVLAEYLHMSAPICMVVAGLIIGKQGRELGMSEETREHIDVFWELLDEIFNAVLFLLIGLEIIIISLTYDIIVLGGLAIGAVLIGRFISVAGLISILSIWQRFDKGTIRVLTWGGLRGGISIALALSLPNGEFKDIILPITYIVVLFSIIVQGLSFAKLLKVIGV